MYEQPVHRIQIKFKILKFKNLNLISLVENFKI